MNWLAYGYGLWMGMSFSGLVFDDRPGERPRWVLAVGINVVMDVVAFTSGLI